MTGGAGVPFNGGLPNFFLGFAAAFPPGNAACIVGLRVENDEFGVEPECGDENLEFESGDEDRLSLRLEEAVDISRSFEGSLE